MKKKKHNTMENNHPNEAAGENLREETAGTAQHSPENDGQAAARSTPAEADLNARLEEANDKYVRLVAEFENYRRRTARERLELIETAGKEVLTGFLPFLDDCERALAVLRQTDATASAIEGTELIYSKLMNYLKSKGISRIEALGETFDTDFHEAVAQVPAPAPEQKNKVIDITEQGYLLHGKVVRFAKVVVGI